MGKVDETQKDDASTNADDLEKQLKDARAGLSDEDEEIARLKERIRELEEQLANQDEEMARRKEKIGALGEQVEELEEQLAEALRLAEHPGHQLFELRPWLGLEVEDEPTDGKGLQVLKVKVNWARKFSHILIAVLHLVNSHCCICYNI